MRLLILADQLCTTPYNNKVLALKGHSTMSSNLILDWVQKSALHTGGVGFKRCGHLPGRESLTKAAIVLHYCNLSIQCLWSLTPTKSQDMCSIDLDHPLFLSVSRESPNLTKVQC